MTPREPIIVDMRRFTLEAAEKFGVSAEIVRLPNQEGDAASVIEARKWVSDNIAAGCVERAKRKGGARLYIMARVHEERADTGKARGRWSEICDAMLAAHGPFKQEWIERELVKERGNAQERHDLIQSFAKPDDPEPGPNELSMAQARAFAWFARGGLKHEMPL